MENKPLISVIINCFNSDSYLKEALDSVIAQTYQNWEIIFWDNQSTDNSASIVQSYNDKRIRYFYAPEHTSLGEGRNQALQKARGEYISFLDCDDVYFPSKLEKNLLAFENETIGLIYSNGYTHFQEQNKKKPFYTALQVKGYVYEKWLASYQVMIPSVMFRKKVLEGMNYWFDKRFSMIEEFDFFMRVAQTWKINYIDEKLCLWRSHQASLSKTKRELFEKENRIFLEDILKQTPALEKEEFIKKFRAKIAYQTFYNQWFFANKNERHTLLEHIAVEPRLGVVYLFSWFPKIFFKQFLHLISKS